VELHFQFGIKEFTGKSVCALLKESNIEHLENLSFVSFDDDDVTNIEKIACEKGLTIYPALPYEKNISDWFTCDRGVHMSSAARLHRFDDDDLWSEGDSDSASTSNSSESGAQSE
jgi:hypothetical protein